jgi:hypothetical protein
MLQRLTCRFPAVCSSICVCQLLSTLRGHTINVPRGPSAAGGLSPAPAAAAAAAAASASDLRFAAACSWLALLPAACRQVTAVATNQLRQIRTEICITAWHKRITRMAGVFEDTAVYAGRSAAHRHPHLLLSLFGSAFLRLLCCSSSVGPHVNQRRELHQATTAAQRGELY